MKSMILDSYAILVFLQGEKGHNRVKQYLDDASEERIKLFISIINLAEVFYKLARKVGEAETMKIISSLRKLDLEIVSATDALVFRAAEIKAQYPISLADCFAVVLARQQKAPILTGDPEFKKVAKFVKISVL